MKTSWAKKVHKGLLLLGLAGAGVAFVGCADTYYGANPAYRGGYYASYSSGYPYYGGYGYPYRAYGPYYGGYGSPYYGYAPYYGGTSVVIGGSRTYTYRDRYGRPYTVRRQAGRVRDNNTTTRTTRTTRATRTGATKAQRVDNDDERRYYTRP